MAIFRQKAYVTVISILLLLTLLSGCAGTPTPPPDTSAVPQDTTASPITTPADTTEAVADTTEAQQDNTPEEKPMKILFIGNSLTYYNDMPALLMKLGQAAGKDIYTFKATVGSSTMCQQISSTTEIGKLVDAAFQKSWTHVVIQPSRRITDKENTVKTAELAAAKVLDERIKAAGAETVIYATWGNNTGEYTAYKMNADGINATTANKYSISRADHTAYMKSVSEEFATALVAPMVDCASIFEFMATKYPDINMYHTDERHPSLYGSYAVACAFYAHFYNESPVDAAALYHNGIPADIANLLALAANHIVLGGDAPNVTISSGGDTVSTITIQPVKWTGTGSESDPFIIADAGNFMYMVELSHGGESFKGKYIKQTADIDLKGGALVPAGTKTPFSGNYSGGGHKISDFSVTSSKSAGIFAQASGAVISGIECANATFKGEFAGGIVGDAKDGTIISDCVVKASSSVEASIRAGGIAASLFNSKVRGCVNHALSYVTGQNDHCYAGGIVAFAADDSFIELCYNDGDVTVYMPTANKNGNGGGIAGCNGLTSGGSASISKCVNRGLISFTYDGKNASRAYTGGIVGRAGNSNNQASSLSECYNTGNIINKSTNTKYYPGIGQMCGVFANTNVTLTNCFGLDSVSEALTKAYGPDPRYSNYVAGKEGSDFKESQYFRLSDTLNLLTSQEMEARIAQIIAQIPAYK